MDDALLVRFVDCRTDLIENVGHPLQRQTFFLSQDVAERATIEILHHEVSDLAFFNVGKTEIRNVDHIRVTQAACGARFPLETLDKLVIANELRRNEFQRDVTLSAHVGGKINCAHTALSQQMFEAVFLVEHLADVVFESTHEKPMLSHL